MPDDLTPLEMLGVLARKWKYLELVYSWPRMGKEGQRVWIVRDDGEEYFDPQKSLVYFGATPDEAIIAAYDDKG